MLMRSTQRLVVDRLKNYFQKYLPVAQEITEKDVIERGGKLGTPKFAKLHSELIAARLDARPKRWFRSNRPSAARTGATVCQRLRPLITPVNQGPAAPHAPQARAHDRPRSRKISTAMRHPIPMFFPKGFCPRVGGGVW